MTGSEARERLSMVASTDHLTGLANQHTFSDSLEDEVRRARRCYRRPLSLVLIDLDHFKLVNDTHGHDVGNRVLAELANRLSELRRGGEIIARVGGEDSPGSCRDGRRRGTGSGRARAGSRSPRRRSPASDG